MDSKIIGVDIGATKIHIGVVQGSQILEELIFPTNANAPEEQIINEFIEGIEKISSKDFKGIGIGVPGLIDEKQGIVYDLWNIPSWKEVHLKKKLEAHFNKQVEITNDANMFALGEKNFGEGKPYKNMVGVSLGTGFGTGIIVNDRLYSGTLSGAGEMADIPYLDKRIEDYCSGKFFKQQYNIDGREVHEKAKNGDSEALIIFQEYGKHLGNSLKLILYMLSPEAIFLGGSVSQSFPYFEKSMRERIGTFPFSRITKDLVIKPAITKHSTLLGAASLLEDLNKSKVNI